MIVDRRKLGTRLKDFIENLDGLDWRLCVTSTSVDGTNPEKGKLLSFNNGRVILTPQDANAEELFLERLTSNNVGQSGNEQGIRAMHYAFSNPDSRCFRPNAALATVVISDEDEASTGGYPEFKKYHPQYRDLVPENLPENLVKLVTNKFGSNKIFTAHSIVIRSKDQACWNAQNSESAAYYGTRYEKLSYLTGGIIGDICASSFTSQLRDFSDRIQDTLSSVKLQCVPISSVGLAIHPRHPDQATEVSGDKVIFNPPLPAGTEVGLRYQCPGP